MNKGVYSVYRVDFLAACEKGDYNKMKTIADTNKGKVTFHCPITHENGLHKCARNNGQEGRSSVKIAKYILAKKEGSALNLRESKGNYTLLILATHLQNEDMVHELIDATEITDRNFFNWSKDKDIVIEDTIYTPFSTALHVAILSGNINIITILLSHGAAFWITNQNGETALELAQRVNNGKEIMSIFCDPNNQFAHLLISVEEEDAKTIMLLKIFLKNGLDVNCKDYHGNTLLHTATHTGRTAIMRFLISRGAHTNALMLHTRNAIDYNMAVLHYTARITNAETMTCLLDAGADVNLKDGNGRTSLHILCSTRGGDVRQSLNCCELLLQHGAHVNVKCAEGATPYDKILNNGTKIGLAVYIISAGVDTTYFRDPFRSSLKLVSSLKYIPNHIHKLFLEFLFESGFPIETLLPGLRLTISELATYIQMKLQTPRTFKRLAANVIRKTMVPNALVGLNRLPLPPGFDKQYIILDPKHLMSMWLKQYDERT